MAASVTLQNKNTNQEQQSYFSACSRKMSDTAQVAQKAAGKVFGFCTHPLTVILTVGGLADSCIPFPGYVRFPASIAIASAAVVWVSAMKMYVSKKTESIGPSSSESNGSHVIEITKANYKREVLESKTPVILESYTRAAGGTNFDKRSRQLNGTVKFVKLNVEAEASLAKELEIGASPTFLMFKDGKIVSRWMGSIPSSDNCIFAFSMMWHLM